MDTTIKTVITYIVLAGRYDDGAENLKYISEPWIDFELALRDFEDHSGYPTVRIESCTTITHTIMST